MTNEKPNVIVFMTDQQRASTIYGQGPTRAITPNLDRFRTEAVTFTNGYTPSPHCCPSRTSFFSGVYPSEHGVWNNVNVTNALSRGPRTGTPFWSKDFIDAGYSLATTGKWHVSNSQSPSCFGWKELEPKRFAKDNTGSLEEQRAAARERELGVLRTMTPSPDSEPREEGEIIRPGWPAYHLYGSEEEPFGDASIVKKGIEFIESASQDPWFLYVGTLGPHDPYVPPQRFIDLYEKNSIQLPESFHDSMSDKPNLYQRTRDRFDQLTIEEHREALRRYLAFCSYEDYLFGELLDALDKSGKAENTIVVYLSDHGDYTAEHGLWGKGLPAFSPAYEIPAVIRDPRFQQENKLSVAQSPITLVDIGPTLIGACGIEPSCERSGQDLSGILRGTSDPDAPRDVFFQTNGNEVYGIQRTVLSGRWKLVVNLFDFDELYDMEQDPDELTNLLWTDRSLRQVGQKPLANIPEEYISVLEELYEKIWRFAIDHDDEIINEYILTAFPTFGPIPYLGASVS